MSRIISLDCETQETALASIAAIYGIEAAAAAEFLRSIDMEAQSPRLDPPRPVDEELQALFEDHFKKTPAAFDRVYWFHLTRALPESDFSDGLQPLSASLDRVWSTVLRVFKGSTHEAGLLAMRASGVPDFQYNFKAHDSFHAGPYAMLVAEVADAAGEIGNHDYLWLPEIMEDICNGYFAKTGLNIHDDLAAALSPFIVKFWGERDDDRSCVSSALYYLNTALRGEPLCRYANTCFDGENEAIPAAQISKVITARHDGKRQVRTVQNASDDALSLQASAQFTLNVVVDDAI